MPAKWDGKAADSVRAGALSTIADDSHEDSLSSSSDNDPEQAGRPELTDSSSDEYVETITVKLIVKQQANPTQQSKHTDESSSDDECESGAKGTSGAQAPVVAKGVAPRPA